MLEFDRQFAPGAGNGAGGAAWSNRTARGFSGCLFALPAFALPVMLLAKECRCGRSSSASGWRVSFNGLALPMISALGAAALGAWLPLCGP